MKKPHYFYKVSVDKKVARDIQTFMYRCQDVEQTALNWARKQGAEHYYEWQVEWEPWSLPTPPDVTDGTERRHPTDACCFSPWKAQTWKRKWQRCPL